MTEGASGAGKSRPRSALVLARRSWIPARIWANGSEHMGATAWVARPGACRFQQGGARRLHTRKSHSLDTNYTTRCFSTP